MTPLTRALLDRYNAMLSGAAAASFEAALLKEHARVVSDLIREAERYENEGQTDLAARLRDRADALAIPASLALSLTEQPKRRGRPPKQLEARDDG